jgi:two-component system cell cycle response regulator DivK
MTKVLVVEDTPLNMELIIEILDGQGFEIDSADDGEKALKMVEKKLYDLILMDIELPGMDGTEVAKIIKTKPDYKDVPVLALTAYAMKGDKEKLLGKGFNDYIPKPIDVSKFMKILNKYRK